jgi:hypothetical protein
VFPANDDKIESARVDFEGESATIVSRVAGARTHPVWLRRLAERGTLPAD